ncbi:MAG: DUF1273 family protein [Clostridia bacterium]|nr:DUF1273 family protein [Clostridia bacterium]
MESFDRNITCCVSGHRVVKKDLDIKKLERVLNKSVDFGYKYFLVGMALGFDTICFQILEKIRKEKDIKIVACIPCLTQDYKFNFEEKKEYKRMLDSADIKIILSETYNPWCMQKRNRFMVDNSSRLISYLRDAYGGTFNTVKYAQEQGIDIESI